MEKEISMEMKDILKILYIASNISRFFQLISPNIIEFIPFQKTNFVLRSSCMIEFLFTIKNIIEI